MKSILTKLVLTSLCLIFGGCKQSIVSDDNEQYFKRSINTIDINSGEWKKGNSGVLNDPNIDISIHFKGEDSSQTILNTLQGLAMYKTHVYLNIGKDDLYFGFPVHDGYETHSWHKYLVEEFRQSQLESNVKFLDLKILSSEYIVTNTRQPIAEIEKSLKKNGSNLIVNIVLSETAKFKDLLPILKSIHKNKTYQYIIKNEIEQAHPHVPEKRGEI